MCTFKSEWRSERERLLDDLRSQAVRWHGYHRPDRSQMTSPDAGLYDAVSALLEHSRERTEGGGR